LLLNPPKAWDQPEACLITPYHQKYAQDNSLFWKRGRTERHPCAAPSSESASYVIDYPVLLDDELEFVVLDEVEEPL